MISYSPTCSIVTWKGVNEGRVVKISLKACMVSLAVHICTVFGQGPQVRNMRSVFQLVLLAALVCFLVNIRKTEGQLSFNVGRSLNNVSFNSFLKVIRL